MNQNQIPVFPPHRVWNFGIPCHTGEEEGLWPLFLHSRFVAGRLRIGGPSSIDKTAVAALPSLIPGGNH